jgi:uncharacterized RDD family membrane protein YckC
MLDTQIEIETPEGVDLRLSPAGPVVRAQAWALDALLKSFFYAAAMIAAALLGAAGAGVALIALFLISWIYPVLFEVLRGGATPGKRTMGLRVVHDNGTPVGWPASMIRNLLRAADFLPLGYGVGLTSTLLRSDFKRLGDLAAGTIVVYEEAPPGEILLPKATPVPPPHPLTLGEQRAVVEFAQRVPTLTEERVAELARIARPLVGIRREGAAQLLGIARWIVGIR